MKTATAPLPPLRSVKVLDQLRERIRYLHYSLRTEQAYVHWVRAFIRFHGVRHAVDDALLQYLSPLGWEHINLTGDYLWRSSAKIGAGKFRPLRPLQPA